MPLEPLCPSPTTWRIETIAPQQDRLVLYLEPVRNAAACPLCGRWSRCVHSRYQRQPWDLPWGRWPVQLVVHARRFFCDASDCPRRIFTESFPGVLGRYARQTARLCRVLLELAHASGAERGMFGIRVKIGHKNFAKDFSIGKTTTCTVTQVCVCS